MQDLVETQINTLKQRTAVIAVAVIVLILAWVVSKMQLGNLLSENTSASEIHAPDAARLAMRMAPGDPHARHLFALTSEDPAAAIPELENAVASSPNDFRWRVALGRAYEQNEELGRAERQFDSAVELAPHYVVPRWHRGNFYLRQGRESEAVEELRHASVGHFSYRQQVFSLAWDYFDGVPAQVERIAADNAETRAYLAKFFAQRGTGPDAVRIWDGLSNDEKNTYKAVGSLVLQELYGKGSFPEALHMARQMGVTEAVPETVTNPSFEEPMSEGPTARFGWEIVPGEGRIDIIPDNQRKRSGSRSLKFTFRGNVKTELANAFQAVVVQPQTDYTLSFHYRTEALRSPVRPMLQVVSANDNEILASTEMFPSDSKDWTQIKLPFRTRGTTSAISIRTYRQSCGEQCSITGSLWYDDFELVRTTGSR